MRAFKLLLGPAVLLGFFALAQGNPFAAPVAQEALKEETVKWTVNVQPLTGMVDLYLTDKRTGKGITNVKVKAVITMPGGARVEKEMMRMAMKKKAKGGEKEKDKGVPYMLSMDMSPKGAYLFDITGRAGKRNIHINFRYEVK